MNYRILNGIGPKTVTVASGKVFTLPISIAIDPADLHKTITDFNIEVSSIINGDKVTVEQETRFFAP